MRVLTTAAQTALSSGSVALVQLIRFQFPSGDIAINSSTWALVWEGVTYLGAYGLGTVSAVSDAPGEVKGLTFELSGGPANMIALALDESDQVQGVACSIRTAIIETVNYTIVDAPVDWSGYLDTMSIGSDGEREVIRVTAESTAVDLLRGTARYYTDTDQRAINAADGSFKYVVDQIDKPLIWPAKSFFYQ